VSEQPIGPDDISDQHQSDAVTTGSELTVGVLAFPGCFGSEVFGVVDLLTMATHVAEAHHQPPKLRTIVMSPRRRVEASGGTSIGVRPLQSVDVLVVPGFEFTPGADLTRRTADLAPEIDAIRDQIHAGTAVASICVGAFLLGEAGALDRRRVTTAWLFAEDLRRAVPTATVVADQLVVTDRGITTTAAFSAMYDFVLELVQRHHGALVARRTARIALVDDARTSQSPYVDDALLPTPGSSFSSGVQRHLERHIEQPYDLRLLAEHFHVSTRTLLRRYRAETGTTPLTHLQQVRVRRARHLLATTDLSLGEVHRSVGYRDNGAFNELFVRQTGLRPRDYRARFGASTPGSVAQNRGVLRGSAQQNGDS